MSRPVTPRPRTLSDIKAKLLQPATTSNFECYFSVPSGLPLAANKISYDPDRLLITCSEASLPGSSIATHEINNDYTGVTERHGYRRLYDDKADFTFYVDTQYYQIKFFETWMRYVVNEQYAAGYETNPAYTYRVNYPATYQTDIFITKFEKDYGAARRGRGYTNTPLVYKFIKAFPTNITSMPVSYETSSLLKVTVSFTYSRYVIASSSSFAGTQAQASLADPSSLSPNSMFGIDTTGLTGPSAPFAQGTGINENLAIWALSNQNMISSQVVSNPGNYLADQQQILNNANLAYPVGSPQRTLLLQKAKTMNPKVKF